ncbi:Protein kinase, partial [Friedmanniomyces endolithicus]
YSDSDPDAGTDPEYATHEEQERRRRKRAQQDGGGSGRRGSERYGKWNDYGYTLPEDPWVIQARFKKEGMFPPGVQHPSSTHSSRVDLRTEDKDRLRRRSSTVSSGNASQENFAMSGPAPLSATNSAQG